VYTLSVNCKYKAFRQRQKNLTTRPHLRVFFMPVPSSFFLRDLHGSVSVVSVRYRLGRPSN